MLGRDAIDPALLRRNIGGITARVVTGGTIQVGDSVRPAQARQPDA
jgi:MOSC domain-containing protein YiiM